VSFIPQRLAYKVAIRRDLNPAGCVIAGAGRSQGCESEPMVAWKFPKSVQKGLK